MYNIVQNLSLKDVWEHIHGNYVDYTYVRSNCASRIDRAYISGEPVNLIHNRKVLPVVFSDNDSLVVLLKQTQITPIITHGWGYWKLKPSFAAYEDVKNIIRELKSNPNYKRDVVFWWFRVFKTKVKASFKSVEIEQNLNKRLTDFYYGSLRELKCKLIAGEKVEHDYQEIKCVIKDLRDKQINQRYNNNFIQIVSDKISLYNIMVARTRNKSMNIKKLENDNHENITGVEKLLNHTHGYFTQKYLEKQSITNSASILFDSIDVFMTPQDNENLIKAIKKEEILSALNTVSKKKTPGPDGLTYEFYIENFSQISNILVTIFNNFLMGKNVPSEFTEGIVILIPKNSNPTKLDQFREITLSNCDYKLFTKIIKIRLESFANHLISKKQTCGNNVTIFTNLMKIRDLVTDKQKGCYCTLLRI